MPSEQFTNLVTMLKAQREAAPPGPTDVKQLRAGFEMLGAMMPPVGGVEREPIEVAGMNAARLVPADPMPDAKILYLHGGGYAIGSIDSHSPLVSNLAKAAQIEVILPEYRLAPEDPYPAAVDDAVAAYSWVLDQGTDPSHLAVAGESAGGGLTLALLLALKGAGSPLPAAAVLISPWADVAELGSPSPESLDIDFLRPEAIAQFAEWYAPADTRAEPLCSPARGDLSGLPPLLIQTGEAEILCDQDMRLASAAKDAGVDVTLEVEPGMFHAWPLFAGALPEADEAIARIASFVRSKIS